MKKTIALILLFSCLLSSCTNIQRTKLNSSDSLYANKMAIPKEVQILMAVYPSFIVGFENNHIIFANGTRLIFDDGIQKSPIELMDNPDIKNIFTYKYQKGIIDTLPRFHNPGRIRNEELLKIMYGGTSIEVQQRLTTIIWCPKLVNQRLQVTTVNGVDKKFEAVSAELDEHPEWKDYLFSLGTFNWRAIRGTSNRLSPHCFGIAIDINTAHSNYWQWDYNTNNENIELLYRNRIPQGIVDIFEKHGFIWGGKWYHYDTMHFEYRPELLFAD